MGYRAPPEHPDIPQERRGRVAMQGPSAPWHKTLPQGRAAPQPRALLPPWPRGWWCPRQSGRKGASALAAAFRGREHARGSGPDVPSLHVQYKAVTVTSGAAASTDAAPLRSSREAVGRSPHKDWYFPGLRQGKAGFLSVPLGSRTRYRWLQLYGIAEEQERGGNPLVSQLIPSWRFTVRF